MCVPLPHEQDTNSADTAYGIACLTILADRVKSVPQRILSQRKMR
jgi:hypothetical protein